MSLTIMRYTTDRFTRLLTRRYATTIVLVSLFVSQVLVCGHSHAGLSGRTLAKHLALFHASDARPIPIDAWHLHAEWRAAGLPADLDVSDAIATSILRPIARIDAHVAAHPRKGVAALGREISTGPHGPVRHRRALHLQLATFLI